MTMGKCGFHGQINKLRVEKNHCCKSLTVFILISFFLSFHVQPLEGRPRTEHTSGYLAPPARPISPEENPHRSLLLPLSVNGVQVREIIFCLSAQSDCNHRLKFTIHVYNKLYIVNILVKDISLHFCVSECRKLMCYLSLN